MRLKPKLIELIRGATTVGILIYGAYYVYTNLESFRALFEVNWKIVAVMVTFILINIFASASENAIFFRVMEAPIGNIESFGLTNVSAFFNLILPQGGSITKAIYLKQKYGIPYSKTPAIYQGLLVIYLLIGSGIILSTNLITTITGGTVPLLFWVIVLLGFTSGILLVIDIPQGALSKSGRIGVWISNYSDGWKNLRTNKTCLVNASVWQFIIFVSAGIWVSTAYYSLGIKINPLLGVSLSVIISFTNILTIVPGNLGIQEAAYGYLTYLSGMLFAQGVIVSTLTRVVLLFMTLLLTPASWYYLFYRQNIKLNRKRFGGLQ